ncbi:DUF3108 domain-containing protein [candidate division WOR-3 bacterium]|uniref:DUF3108 domain-containing protein n=1 Tax=candidate division WOR-3 bacterium TaxID=2052148 RepID=A0A9D5QDM1_UNCW3|nr:DUF3108 domain-containing protein [candidate division WOR-3 bacterium]MBD3365232.1 DUF3108 domain-containing protein [candidate division WOR-3 bacterium]
MKILLLLLLSALPSKEVLAYDVHLGPIHAGTMKLILTETTYQDQPCYRFRSILNSLESMDWLFTLNDTLISYVTKDSFKVLYFEKRMHETNYDTIIRVRFDWEGDRIIYEDGASFPLPPGTLDVVSIYYYFRLNPLDVGEETLAVLHADRITEQATVRAVKEVAVRTSSSSTGSLMCTKYVPDVEGKGSFGSGGNLLFYLSNDSYHRPALIKTVMTLGSLTARLKWAWSEN